MSKLKRLQHKFIRIQQGIFHKKERVIIAVEGLDASGKGGAIKKLTEDIDPRGVRVYPIGPPTQKEQGKHWLYRFWVKLPAPGLVAIFDRTWYGRVLVERVDKLIQTEAWTRGYDEINHFEKMLTDDGVHLIKIFLVITKDEQHARFKARLSDPYKQWKITKEDISARKKWDEYVTARVELIQKTDSQNAPWYVIETDDKEEAREQVLKIVTERLKFAEKWMEDKANDYAKKTLKKALLELK
ncbi:MAG TPA: hypothetical protein VNJ01_09290 [Bacteriovoracaceae bacterium]|nr:hypothetical protein [Bacteriovoracaceae bacterium]